MVDLDSTQIINAEDSLLQDPSTFDQEISIKIISGFEPNVYSITKETVIGRASPSDLIIAAQSLSKQHAKITFNNGQCFITDLGSSNKTYQNKVQLQSNVCYALHNGDEIKLGDVICLFHEEKSTKEKDNTLNQQDSQIYVPVENTLVEEDSPWDVDDDLSTSNFEQTNTEVIPSTQAISDSYDEEEPTQPVKIWNGNSNSTNRLSRTSVKSTDDCSSKKNGVDESLSNGSSLLSASVAATVPMDDQDDGSVVIGSSLLPATVPIDVESTQVNEDNRVEIVSTTKTTFEENVENSAITIETKTMTTTKITTEIEIENTQSYALEPTTDVDKHVDTEIPDTQVYDLESEPVIVKDVTETRKEETHTFVVEGNKLMEETTTIKMTSTKTTTVIEPSHLPMETLAYDLEPTEETVRVETKTKQLCVDTQVYDLDEQIETIKTTVSEKTEMITSTNVVQPDRIIEESLTDDQIQSEKDLSNIESNAFTDTLVNNDMETEQTETTSTEPVIDEKLTEPSDVDKQSEIPETSKHAESEVVLSSSVDDEMVIDEVEKSKKETEMDSKPEQTNTTEVNQTNDSRPIESDEKKTDETKKLDEETESKTLTIETDEYQKEDIAGEGEEVNEEQEEELVVSSSRATRGMPRRNARRARGRRAGGTSTRARVVSTKIYGSRRNQVVPVSVENVENNTTLEETIQSDTEESPQKTIGASNDVESKTDDTQPTTTVPETPIESRETNSTATSSNIRVSARIKARASSGRNRQFPYTDDYIDLDDLEKQTKAANAANSSTNRRSSRNGRNSATPQKRISLRQQPVESTESPDEKTAKQKNQSETHEDMDTGGENEEPNVETTAQPANRKRKSMTPTSSTTTKRTRSTTQTESANSVRQKQTNEMDASPVNVTTTPKRTRKSTRAGESTNENSTEPSNVNKDRPVRIALSSHLNFDQTHLDALRELGFEIMDESCHVDALVVDRIRRTKKFFMCLARGAHILSPAWIEAMIKEKSYISFEKYYLEDTTAETRYGFQLRESVRLAKQKPIFQNYRFFCTKDTSPPYDDLKDIIEAAGGKLIEKVNMSRPGKDLICIVAQTHKNEYEDLSKKGVPIVTEEFALSGVSKQTLDFSSFNLFPNSGTIVKSVTVK